MPYGRAPASRPERQKAPHRARTFAGMLEDAIETAVAGQSSKRKPADLAELGIALSQSAREIAVVADAARIIANLANPRRR